MSTFSRRIVSAALVATVLALGPAVVSARAASPMQRQLTALQAQVHALQKQVKTLKSQVARNTGEVDANWASDACLSAITTDALQGTWAVVDTMAQALQNKTYFGAQQPVNDFQACANLRPAVQRQHGIPPTVQPFQLLINWIHG
jgi:hypothetical protein